MKSKPTVGCCPYCGEFIFFSEKTPQENGWRLCPKCKNAIKRHYLTIYGNILIWFLWGVFLLWGKSWVSKFVVDTRFVEAGVFVSGFILLYLNNYFFGYQKNN